MLNNLFTRSGGLPQIADNKPDPVDAEPSEDVRLKGYPRPPLVAPRRISVAAGATVTENFSFTPLRWHIGTPNGEYILCNQGGSLAPTASPMEAYQLGRGGWVEFPAVSSQVTVRNTGAAAAIVVISPLNTGLGFEYDPGWGV